MDEVVRWLSEQLDTDERIARAAIRAVGDVPGGVPGAADWRFGNAFTDEGGTYWQITTMPPDVDVFGPVELIGSGMSGGGAHEPEIARHAVEHDPARVLREIDAKRQLLADYTATVRIRDEAATRIKAAGDHPDPKDLEEWSRAHREAAILEGPVRLLALPFSHRPGYAEAIASL